MEYGTIERSMYIEATPDVVYEVVSSPEHIKEWFPDDAVLDAAPGGVGEFVWGDRSSPDVYIVPLTVVDASPPRLFSFRWGHPADEVAVPANSLLVEFEMVPSGTGTTLRMTESGFRERGWEIATLEHHYNDHIDGWDKHLPDLVAYVGKLVASK
ncbi:SRPBCC family protein [Nocardia altamirensis]|uniref:SRPBCC family protein n=1 Tax=Nocardia altamirensis TaxID=472158 RepID=UPI00083FF5A7|nr:SRPBCC family protein [Nocardia altamirensis]